MECDMYEPQKHVWKMLRDLEKTTKQEVDVKAVF